MIDKDTKIKIEGIPEGYTERTHSGMNGVWQPKGASCHDKENMFTLKAPEKGLKSELINGEWFWVCGCPSCLGVIDNGFPYWVCEEHDICVDCGKTRKQITESPWGVRGVGFRCKPCATIRDLRIKIKALEKFEEEEHDEWDFRSNDNILCPHCGTKQSEDDMHEGGKEIECETCGGYYDLVVEYSASYSTSINGEKVTLESVLKEVKP